MEAMAIRVFSAFLLFSVGGIRLALADIQPLQNLTKRVGDDAVIECRSESTSSTNQPYWFKYSPQPNDIYLPSKSENKNPAKYSIGNGNNTLTVKSVQLEDAWAYCCAFDAGTDYCANLAVIDSLTASVNPSGGVQIGEAVNLTCSLSYNSPTKDDNYAFPLSDDQDLHLSIFIGNTEIAKGADGTEVVGTSSIPHSKTLSVNRTAERTDAGQQLVCKVSSKNPQYSDSTSADLNVFVETRTAEIIYPNNTKNPGDVYPINSVFTCRGDGYPAPNVEWLNGDANKQSFDRPRMGNATWEAKLPGTYNLICSAKNERSRNATYNNTRCIVQNSAGSSAASTASNKIGLGVGLGIGLGVPILIGLIILIVFLARRKKASQPYPVKQPETKSKSPSTGKAPNGKNSDPSPGPRNNVNPNPNPSYTTPVMPEQTGNSAPRNVRDSPGYGDLGVRHIGGSGSNPHLNESFDSKANASFDSSRNYPQDGNLAIRPGRTSQSPSVPNTSV